MSIPVHAPAGEALDVLSRFRLERGWLEPTRLRRALADLPVVLVGRLRSDRVMLRDPGPVRCGPKGGRPRRHGGVLSFAKSGSWHTPEVTTATDTTRYGKAEAMAWDRMHPRITHRGPWLEHADEELPVLHGTLIRLKVERLPGDRDPKPVWLWCSATGALPADVDRWWQSFLRRFGLEHTFRLMKQALGWTAPKVRHADSADLWTWLIICCPGGTRAGAVGCWSSRAGWSSARCCTCRARAVRGGRHRTARPPGYRLLLVPRLSGQRHLGPGPRRAARAGPRSRGRDPQPRQLCRTRSRCAPAPAARRSASMRASRCAAASVTC